MLPTASEIINQSFSLYRRHWRTLAPFQLGLWLPLLIQFGLGILAIILDAAVPGMSLVNTIVTLAMVAAVAIFIIWNTLALVHTLGALTTGAPAPPG
ncbi:MAG: hypothetical protein HYV42_01875 [Candidatus Magasanikbacteria bacterium]|nr:hypothetical protein [Candidatus Magasanikbacteria bacterium]